MRSDILKTIGESKDIDNIIILTYNIDLMFVQSMLLPKLKKIGHPNLLIFADINRATETFQTQHQWVQGIGTRYRLIPVPMDKHGSFHPKAILLTSEEQAMLIVGSGNLSFAGWRENGETWIKYQTEEITEKPAFSAFHQYLDRIVESIPLNKSITSAIEKAFSGKWEEQLPSSDIIIGRMQDETTLVDQMFESMDILGLERVTICTPFFDPEGDAIKEIFARTRKCSMRVLVQNKRTNLSREAADKLPKEISVLPVEYIREEGEHRSFLHSKFYAFEKSDTVELFVGSANCSRAALMSSGNMGNAELLTRIALSKEEYERLFLSELDFIDSELELLSASEIADVQQDEARLKIIAIRQSGSELRIAFTLPDSYSISSCFINDQKNDFSMIDKANLSTKVTFNPHRVYIEAINQDSVLQSPVFWVDDEIELQISAKDRKLANTIDAKIKYGEWNIAGWIEIMRLIHSNLDYESSLQNRKLPSSMTNDENGHKKFKYDDIFSDDFHLLAKHEHINLHSEKERLHGFQQMLLSWFGVGWKSDFYSDDPENEDTDNDDLDDNDDKPEKIKLPKKRRQAVKKEDKQRALRVARRIVKKLTSPDFIESRPASLLGIDLSIIGTLLCSGLCEGW